MSTSSKKLTPTELGTIEAVLLGFNRHQLPRLLDIKERVDRGEVLDEYEIIFLEETLQEVQSCEYFAESHPEYKLLVAEVANYYDHISHQAMQNQKIKNKNG